MNQEFKDWSSPSMPSASGTYTNTFTGYYEEVVKIAYNDGFKYDVVCRSLIRLGKGVFFASLEEFKWLWVNGIELYPNTTLH